MAFKLESVVPWGIIYMSVFGKKVNDRLPGYILKKMIANLITGCRIILSLIMLCFPVSSVEFYVCYLIAGITDMVDGTIARKLEADCKFGENLDTFADIIFVASAAYKLAPTLEIGRIIWIWIGIIAVIKVINIISGFVMQKRFVAVHSLANKLTGFALFGLPVLIFVIDIKHYALFVCLLATFASIQEGHFIRCKV